MVLPPMKGCAKLLVFAAVVLGLTARIAMLFHAGTGDMLQYHDWGNAVLDRIGGLFRLRTPLPKLI